MDIDIEKLKLKLKDNNIIVSNNELDEVIKYYNHYLDFLEEITYEEYENRFAFINNDNFKVFLDIFKCFIVIQRKGLLSYIDYIFIINNNRGMTGEGTDRDFLNGCLNEILYLYKRYGDDFAYQFASSSKAYILENCLCDYNNVISNSKIINHNYKKIVDKFSDLLFNVENFYGGSNCPLWDYINCIYHYFLHKGIFNNDINRAYQFLDYIRNNLIKITDLLDLYGIIKISDLSFSSYVISIKYDVDNVKKMFNHIDYLYHNFDSKIKIIE